MQAEDWRMDAKLRLVKARIAQKDFAAAIGVTPSYLNEVLNSKRDPQFAKVWGNDTIRERIEQGLARLEQSGSMEEGVVDDV